MEQRSTFGEIGIALQRNSFKTQRNQVPNTLRIAHSSDDSYASTQQAQRYPPPCKACSENHRRGFIHHAYCNTPPTLYCV